MATERACSVHCMGSLQHDTALGPEAVKDNLMKRCYDHQMCRTGSRTGLTYRTGIKSSRINILLVPLRDEI